MRGIRIGILIAWTLGCLLGAAWLVGAVNPAHADDPDVVAEIAVETDKLFALDWWGEEKFGWSVDVDGDWLVVGTPEFTAGQSSPYPGSAYIFTRDTGNPNRWTEVRKIVASDGAPDDQFGYAVTISGDTVVVGAPEADIIGKLNVGAAYVFYRDRGGSNNWGQVTRITPADSSQADEFGVSVTLDDDTLVVGSNQDNIYSGTWHYDQGSAVVYYRNQGGADNWGQVKKITASDGRGNDEFGISVSVNSDSLVVGAWQADATAIFSTTDEGAAYLFHRNTGGANQWGEVKKIEAADRAPGDEFGWSVSIDGDTATVGASRVDVSGKADQGAAYVFYRDQNGANQWGQVKKVTASDGAAGDRFGFAVDVHGNLAVAGAYRAVIEGRAQQGAAYTFRRDEGGTDTWGQVDKLLGRDSNIGDLFGLSVATNGSQFLVGAPYANIGGQLNAGAAYVFVGDAQVINLPIIRK